MENTNWFNNLIKTFKGVLDFITGAITMVLRIPFVGFATWTERLISGTLQAVSEGNSPYPVTVEDIIFNRVPIFDINVFDFNNAGGQTVENNSITYLLKENVAKWYVTIRNLVIAILLLVLVYLGLRMAITAIAEEKAKYKRMLVDWFVSFFIVLFLHYFILIVLKFNDALVSSLASSSNLSRFYQEMRDAARAVSFDTGWLATFVYLALVIMMVKYVWKYANRLLSMYILIIFSPVVAVSYAMDKIKDNRSQALGKWMKEITYTVLIQSVHALLYMVFVVGIIGSIPESDTGSSIGKIVFLLIALGFISEIEKIVELIFGFKASAAASEVMQTTVEALAKFTLAKKWIKTTRKVVREPFRLGKKGIQATGGWIHKNAPESSIKWIKNADAWYVNNKEKLKQGYEAGRNGIGIADYRAMEQIDRDKVNASRIKREKEDFAAAKNAIKTAYQVPANMATGMAVMIDNPWAGSTKLMAAITSGIAFGGISKKQIKKYKTLRRAKLRARSGNARRKMAGASRLRREEIKLKDMSEHVFSNPNIITGEKTIEGLDSAYLRTVSEASKTVNEREILESLAKEMQNRADIQIDESKKRTSLEAAFASELQGQKVTVDGIKQAITNIGTRRDDINVPKNFDMTVSFALTDKILSDASVSQRSLSEKYGADLAGQIHNALQEARGQNGFRRLSGEEQKAILQEATRAAVGQYLKNPANIERILNSLDTREVSRVAVDISNGRSYAQIDKQALTERVLADAGKRIETIERTYGSDLATVIRNARAGARREQEYKNLSEQERAERQKEAARVAITRYLTGENEEKIALRLQEEAGVWRLATRREAIRGIDSAVVFDAVKSIEANNRSIKINERQLGKNIERTLADSLTDSFMGKESSVPVMIQSTERIRFSKAISQAEAMEGFRNLSKQEQERRRSDAVRRSAREYVRDETNRDSVIDRMDITTATKFVTIAINREGSIDRDYSLIEGRRVVSMEAAQKATDMIIPQGMPEKKLTMETLSRGGNEAAVLANIRFEPAAYRRKVIDVIANEVANGYLEKESEIEIVATGTLRENISRAVQDEKNKKAFTSYSEVEKEEAIMNAVEKATKAHLRDADNLNRVIERIDEREIPSIIMKASNMGQGVDIKTEHIVDIQTAQKAAEAVSVSDRESPRHTIETLTKVGSEAAELVHTGFSTDVFRENMIKTLGVEAARSYMDTIVPVTDKARTEFDETVRQINAQPEFSKYTPARKEQERRKAVSDATIEYVRENLDAILERIDAENTAQIVERVANMEKDPTREHTVNIRNAQRAADSILKSTDKQPKLTVETITKSVGEATRLSRTESVSDDAVKERLIETLADEMAISYENSSVPVTDEVRSKLDEVAHRVREKREFERYSPAKQYEEMRKAVAEAVTESFNDEGNLNRTIGTIKSHRIPGLVTRASNASVKRTRISDSQMKEMKKIEPIIRQAINLRKMKVEISEVKTKSATEVVQEMLNKNKKS